MTIVSIRAASFHIRAGSNNNLKQEMTSCLINIFLSYLQILLYSTGVPLNKKLIWRGLTELHVNLLWYKQQMLV